MGFWPAGCLLSAFLERSFISCHALSIAGILLAPKVLNQPPQCNLRQFACAESSRRTWDAMNSLSFAVVTVED
jgi:hypothetical protein